MIRLLIGTGNVGKYKEIYRAIQTTLPHTFHLCSLTDLKITDEPDETGKTFEENSRIKANFYTALSGLPTIADDGGLEIDALNGEPGIHSRRWPGYKATDEELMAYALKQMKGIPLEKRRAKLTTCISFSDRKNSIFLQESKSIDGYISEKPSHHREEGYPYKSLFIVTKYNKYYGDLSIAEHEAINHRRHALTQLLTRVLKHYNENLHKFSSSES